MENIDEKMVQLNKLRQYSIYTLRGFLLRQLSTQKYSIKKLKRNEICHAIVEGGKIDEFNDYIEYLKNRNIEDEEEQHKDTQPREKTIERLILYIDY